MTINPTIPVGVVRDNVCPYLKGQDLVNMSQTNHFFQENLSNDPYFKSAFYKRHIALVEQFSELLVGLQCLHPTNFWKMACCALEKPSLSVMSKTFIKKQDIQLSLQTHLEAEAQNPNSPLNKAQRAKEAFDKEVKAIETQITELDSKINSLYSSFGAQIQAVCLLVDRTKPLEDLKHHIALLLKECALSTEEYSPLPQEIALLSFFINCKFKQEQKRGLSEIRAKNNVLSILKITPEQHKPIEDLQSKQQELTKQYTDLLKKNVDKNDYGRLKARREKYENYLTIINNTSLDDTQIGDLYSSCFTQCFALMRNFEPVSYNAEILKLIKGYRITDFSEEQKLRIMQFINSQPSIKEKIQTAFSHRIAWNLNGESLEIDDISFENQFNEIRLFLETVFKMDPNLQGGCEYAFISNRFQTVGLNFFEQLATSAVDTNKNDPSAVD